MFKLFSRRADRSANIDNFTFNYLLVILATLLVFLLVMGGYFIAISLAPDGPLGTDGPSADLPPAADSSFPYRQEIASQVPDFPDDSLYIPRKSADSDGIYSDFAVLVDVTENRIVASRKAEQDIYPASMAKIMTLIVVVENLKSEDAMNDVITIKKETVEKMLEERASGFGFKEGEQLTVEALLHALILQSDGVAGISLAEYISGSESAFVELMNAKAKEIGMEKTNFQNCTGLYGKYMLSSCKDIAVMMTYAMKNSFCADILSQKLYRLPDSFREDNTYAFYHATLASKFDKLLPDVRTADVVAGKSGWIGEESGYCLVTYAVGDNGHRYVLVTAMAEGSSDEPVYDMEYVYNNYIK